MMAEDAVVSKPLSAQIPCKQGNLQGVSLVWLKNRDGSPSFCEGYGHFGEKRNRGFSKS